MTQPSTMYNRRLTKSELGAWLQMEQTALSKHGGTWTDDLTQSFFELPGTILYLATINGEAVGGAAVYRDIVRCGVSLVSVILSPEHKQKLLSQIVRSSLPLFRSATIRRVELLVDTTGKHGAVRFPLSYMLEDSMTDVLATMGFETVGTAWHCSIRSSRRSSVTRTLGAWDAVPNADGARNLLLEQSEQGGLMCPQVWLALELAVRRGSLKTFTVKNRTQLACGLEMHEDDVFVTFLSFGNDMTDREASANLHSLFMSSNFMVIHLPLLGKKDLDCVRALADMTGSAPQCGAMNIMAKVL